MDLLAQMKPGDSIDMPHISQEEIEEIECLMLEHTTLGEQVVEPATPTQNHFAPGMYVREMFIPAGSMLVGKAHVHEHLNILLSGSMYVRMEDKLHYFKAPCIFKSGVGTKKIGYHPEDTRFATVHVNEDDETDITILEARYALSSEKVEACRKRLMERRTQEVE